MDFFFLAYKKWLILVSPIGLQKIFAGNEIQCQKLPLVTFSFTYSTATIDQLLSPRFRFLFIKGTNYRLIKKSLKYNRNDLQFSSN